MIEFLSTSIGVAEICRKHGISPTTFDNWRKRFMDAGKRELVGIGGNGRATAKALARENGSLKIPWPAAGAAREDCGKTQTIAVPPINFPALSRPSDQPRVLELG